LRKIAGAYRNTPKQYVEKELWVDDILVHLKRQSLTWRTLFQFSPMQKKINSMRAEIEHIGTQSWLCDMKKFRGYKPLHNPAEYLDLEVRGVLRSITLDIPWDLPLKYKKNYGFKLACEALMKQAQSEMQSLWSAFQLKYQSMSSPPVALTEPWGKRNMKRYFKLSRIKSSMLFQMRTGYLGLNDFLHKIKVSLTESELAIVTDDP